MALDYTVILDDVDHVIVDGCPTAQAGTLVAADVLLRRLQVAFTPHVVVCPGWFAVGIHASFH